MLPSYPLTGSKGSCGSASNTGQVVGGFWGCAFQRLYRSTELHGQSAPPRVAVQLAVSLVVAPDVLLTAWSLPVGPLLKNTLFSMIVLPVRCAEPRLPLQATSVVAGSRIWKPPLLKFVTITFPILAPPPRRRSQP